MPVDPYDLVKRHGPPRPVPFVPELKVLQAGTGVGLFTLSGGGYRSDEPPPFWLFAWAGGQALARYVLDHPELVYGYRVLDLATGCGLVAIAATVAGADEVLAVDTDADALAVASFNAIANGVPLQSVAGDLLDVDDGWHRDSGFDLVLAGDVFYSAALARRMLGFLRRAARAGAVVLVGDADRGYLPAPAFDRVIEYRIPVAAAVEEVEIRTATVWRLRETAQRRSVPVA